MRSWAWACAAFVAVGCSSGGSPTTVGPSSAPGGSGNGGAGNGGTPADAGATVATDGGGAGGGTTGTDGGIGPGASDGGVDDGGPGVARCALSGPELVTPTVHQGDNISGADTIAVDDHFIFATARIGKWRDQYVYRMDKAPGGTMTVLAHDGADVPLRRIFADGDSLYIMSIVGGLTRIGKDGSHETTLLPSSDGMTLGLTWGGRLYWSSSVNGTIDSVAESGGAVTVHAQSQNHPQGVAIDGQYLYFTTDTRILRVALGGGAPDTVVSNASVSGSVAVDGAQLYFGDQAGNVYAADKTPGAQPRTLAQLGYGIDYLIADGNRLYVASNTRKPDPTQTPFDEIARVDKDGGNPRLIDTRADLVMSLTTDADYLYYGSSLGVTRACK